MRFIQNSEKEINSEQGEYAIMYPCFSVSRPLALPLSGSLLSVPSALHLAHDEPGGGGGDDGRPGCL